MYNEIGGRNERVATSTFRLGLLKDSVLRDSFTIRPPEGMHQLMRRIEEYKRLEDDWLQVKARPQLLHSIIKSIVLISFNRELGESRELRETIKGSTQRAEGVN